MASHSKDLKSYFDTFFVSRSESRGSWTSVIFQKKNILLIFLEKYAIVGF